MICDSAIPSPRSIGACVSDEIIHTGTRQRSDTGEMRLDRACHPGQGMGRGRYTIDEGLNSQFDAKGINTP